MGAQPLARFLLAAVLALAALTAHAEFTGKVVAVADGGYPCLVARGYRVAVVPVTFPVLQIDFS